MHSQLGPYPDANLNPTKPKNLTRLQNKRQKHLTFHHPVNCLPQPYYNYPNYHNYVANMYPDPYQTMNNYPVIQVMEPIPHSVSKTTSDDSKPSSLDSIPESPRFKIEPSNTQKTEKLDFTTNCNSDTKTETLSDNLELNHKSKSVKNTTCTLKSRNDSGLMTSQDSITTSTSSLIPAGGSSPCILIKNNPRSRKNSKLLNDSTTSTTSTSNFDELNIFVNKIEHSHGSISPCIPVLNPVDLVNSDHNSNNDSNHNCQNCHSTLNSSTTTNTSSKSSSISKSSHSAKHEKLTVGSKKNSRHQSGRSSYCSSRGEPQTRLVNKNHKQYPRPIPENVSNSHYLLCLQNAQNCQLRTEQNYEKQRITLTKTLGYSGNNQDQFIRKNWGSNYSPNATTSLVNSSRNTGKQNKLTTYDCNCPDQTFCKHFRELLIHVNTKCSHKSNCPKPGCAKIKRMMGKSRRS